MRWMSGLLVGLVWLLLSPTAPGPAFAEDAPSVWLTRCHPGPLFVPGRSLGFVVLGTSVAVLQSRFGAPRSVQELTYGGHRWQRLLFGALSVLARDNMVMAATMPQVGIMPVDTDCPGTLASVPFNLPLSTAIQPYGAPSARLLQNGLQYLLYNAQGALFGAPAPGNPVQWLTIYPAGQYCSVAPVLVSLGGLASGLSGLGQCGQ